MVDAVLKWNPLEWKRIKLILEVNGQFGWMNSHAQVPTALSNKGDDNIRIYFSSRPKRDISLTSYIDLDTSKNFEIIDIAPKPILELGEPGMFDEHGIMPSSVIRKGGDVYLYYSGWSRGIGLPYSNFTGLAISEDNGNSFKKIGPGPILDRTYWGPYSATSPCVIEKDGVWHMFFCSGTDWVEINGKKEHVYDIKKACSWDGIKWEASAEPVIKQQHKNEAITRPTIYDDGNKYHMWFCYRDSIEFRNGAGSYKIGYASSKDLTTWERKKFPVEIIGAAQGWDSMMTAYPNIIRLESGELVMFYNGNGFGEKGFGVAIASTG